MSRIKLLWVLISVLLLAVSMPGVYGDGEIVIEEITIVEGFFVDGEEYIGSNSTGEEIEYSSISDSSSSNDVSEVKSSDIVDDVVATYADGCKDNLGWDIYSLVDSFMNCFEGIPDGGFFNS